MHTSGSGGANPIPSSMTRHQYASDSILQSYDLYIPPSRHRLSSSPPKIWIIYLHGGYFRDPKVTSTSFRPALSLLVTSPVYASLQPHVAGYASINYRLSPHPSHPQDPAKTPSYELRTAAWPQHLTDVRAAIAHLQAHHHFGSNYLLVGHSVGATMALLTALLDASDPSSEGAEFVKPTALLGVCGIYDFPRLHDVFPAYVDMTLNALKTPENVTRASPALYSADEYVARWTSGGDGATGTKTVMLAHSRDDGLVDWSQVEAMRDVFGAVGRDSIDCRVVEVKGLHNEVWERGEELARVIDMAARAMLAEMDAGEVRWSGETAREKS